ncbi:MAG: hypothetical protein PWP23_2007 [Candidatus Sumerlaeota bacterium]|nr:hypothetical protein [Candidatus Sumerlaeota bacterium]
MESTRPVKSTFLLLLSVMLLASGCAASRTPEFAADSAGERLRSVAETARHHSMTWNISHRGVKGSPWLGVDDEVRLRTALLGDLDAGSPEFMADGRELLERMLELGTESLRLAAAPEEQNAVLADAAAVQQREREAFEALAGEEAAAKQWLVHIKRALPPAEPHAGRTWRALSAAPAWPFVRGWIAWHAAHEWRGPNWHDFAYVRLYEPDASRDAAIVAHLGEATDDELLRFYAPVIAQELAETPDYRDDLIGAPELVPDRHGDPVGRVDGTRPTIYGHISHAFVQGRWLNQVNYSFWYNDHPAGKKDDPEAGMVEGQLLRITLDENNRPLVAETTYACGCYHRLYPVEAFEAAAERAFGEPVSGPYALADDVPHRIDPAIPELAGTFDSRWPHPLVYVRSGFHMIAAVKWGEAAPEAWETFALELQPSVSLEQLPWGGGTASLFARDGLVRGGDRPEARMLYPSGLYHAGTPRVRGIHEIHFDEYDYDDPALLETMLRIPELKEIH